MFRPLLPALLLLVACNEANIGSIDNQPEVAILAPLDGSEFEPGEALFFCALVSDEDDIGDLEFLVQSSVDGVLSESDGDRQECGGGNVGVDIVLSDADHVLSLSATDGRDQTGTDEVSVVAVDNSAPWCEISVDPDSVEIGEPVEVTAMVADEDSEASELWVLIESNLEGSLYEDAPESSGEISFDWTPAESEEHLLSLLVTDPRGLTDGCSATLYVDPCADADLDGWTTCDGDCDDSRTDVYPDAEEVADGVDNDCDEIIDEGTSLYDDDEDGFSELDGDCDDEDAGIHPDAEEIPYDGIDQDCDGSDAADVDGDGWASDTSGGSDCDDDDASINPAATEVYYDGVDQDCDGGSDYDADGDGYDADTYGGDDCDDGDASISPAASESWYDGVDGNCDGASDYDQDGDGHDFDAYGGDDCDDLDPSVYAGASETWYDGVDGDCDGASDYDQDGDGYLLDSYGGADCDDTDASVSPAGTETFYDGVDGDCDGASDYDADGDGHDSDAYGGDDCDDGDASISPSATEVWYDGVDGDCDGASDYDQDGDLYWPTSAGGVDCDDTDASVNPAATEVWYDGVDSDCDGASDYDQDGDGYLLDSYGGTDCDDTDASINPANTETFYDGVDGDCDGASDYDADSDGYDSDAYGGTDCDDGDSSVSPAATEIYYDGDDQDCDGASDYDADGDGYDSDAYGGTDCDDGEATVNLLTPEVRDGLDNNCDDSYDEGLIVVGDLIVSEIMKDPTEVYDSAGEWFEVYNTTSVDITIGLGWLFEDRDGDSFSLPAGYTVLVSAGDYAVLGRTEDTASNGGADVDYGYATGMDLGNGADEIVLVHDGTEIDEVAYLDGSGWPDPSGSSISLDPAFLNSVDNDDYDNWCSGSTNYGDGDNGTPGSVNDGC